jgi:GT2 family glycosyltransferase
MTPATVIVPTVRPAGRLERLLESLERQTQEAQVLVVDNDSPGGAAATIAEDFRSAEVIRLPRNEGFSRAVNIAARQAEGDALVLVNDDCVCDPGFVAELAGALDPRAGVVMGAGVMRDVADQRLIDTAGMELDPTLLVFDYLNGEPLEALDSAPSPVGPSAAAASFDRSAFLEAGGFDERLFAYWEDVDLVLRLRATGGACALASRAQGVHEHSATLGSGSAHKNALMGFGRGYVLRKWGVVNGRRLPAVVGRDAVICAGQAVFDRNLAGLRARVRGFRAADPRHTYPADAVSSNRRTSVLGTLARRARRRRRLAGGGASR